MEEYQISRTQREGNTEYLMLRTEDIKGRTAGKCLSQIQKQYIKWMLTIYSEKQKMPCVLGKG